MADNRKIIRILKLLDLLQQPQGYTAKRLSDLFELKSNKTIYRDFEVLEELGFHLQTDHQNRYHLKTAPPYLVNQPALNPGYYEYLSELIQRYAPQDQQGAKILRHLAIQQQPHSLAGSLGLQINTQKRVVLEEAILEQKQIKVYKYHSTHSATDRHRLLEPIALFDGGRRLWAYEVDQGLCKQFKLDRMEDIEVSNKPFSTQAHHRPLKADAFGMAGEQQLPVTFQLTAKAYRILIEQHPDAASCICSQKNGDYVFKGTVCHYMGVGRFILSLPGLIRSVDPEAFVEYLIQERKKEAIQ